LGRADEKDEQDAQKRDNRLEAIGRFAEIAGCDQRLHGNKDANDVTIQMLLHRHGLGDK
jgi:hypothetical protein